MLFECKKVSFGYENQQVIKDLSFQVQEGEYVCVVGENGSGKSTLIKGLLGLIPAGSGQVNYGKEISNHVIGYLPQQTSSQKDFPATVWEVILSGCLSTRKGRFFYSKEDKEKARRQMRHLELENLASRSFGELSGGQQQRVLIARALCATESLLILDEPINGLDPQGIIEMRQLLLNLNQKYGITILVSSHILDELSRLATHYGFIDNGKMVKEISASDLENSFRKSVRIEVTDGKALAEVLEQTGLPYKILTPNVAEVYSRVNISRLTSALEKYQCEVLSIQEREENLESYYVNLIGGASHE